MQCACGGMTRDAEAVRSKLDVVLSFLECTACGRVSGAVLFIKGVEVARDPEARAIFRALDKAYRNPQAA